MAALSLKLISLIIRSIQQRLMGKSYKDLKDVWYKKLKAKGFEDIENTNNPNLPLKEWHALKANAKRYRRIKDTNSEYQRLIDNFINHPTFKEACDFVTRHGNSQFESHQAKTIWLFHTEGLTIRNIAMRMDVSKSPVQEIINRLREWMKYLGRD